MENSNVNDKTIESIYEKLDNLDRKISSFIENFVEVRTKLGVAENRIKDTEISLTEKIKDSENRLITKTNDFENRLRGLEASDRKWAVLAIVISGSIGIIVSGIAGLITFIVSKSLGG